ncbi:MAG: hypothetical protein GY847_00970 [Proteobacteria bacterium]|nr:hypothetical protein [Pseudomonadota bacterium]
MRVRINKNKRERNLKSGNGHTLEYQVKGSTIQSKFDFVEKNFGQDAKIRLKQKFEDRKNLFPILSNGWYSYDFFVETLEAIANEHFNGNLSRLEAVGAESAEKALSTVYRSFVRTNDFLGFLRHISKLHHLFYNIGYTEVLIHEDKCGCDILHRDKPRHSEADLFVASGFYQKSAELHGVNIIKCTFHIESEGPHFIIRWFS